MSSSLHAWIEIGFDRVEGSRSFRTFAGPDLGSDPILKKLMAGDGHGLSVYVMRGFPPEVSRQCEEDASFRVSDELASLGVGAYCTRAEADEWVRQGKSVYRGDDLVTDPDGYWHSWLVAPELEEVQRRYCQLKGEGYLPLEAVIAAMKVLDKDPGHPSRLVFWFRA